MSQEIKVFDINQAEYQINRLNNQLRNTQQQLRNAEGKAQKAAQKAMSEGYKKIQREMDSREMRMQARLSDLNHELRETETRYRKALKDQAKSIAAQIDNLQDWTKSNIDLLNSRVDKSFTEIKDIRAEIGQIFEKEANETKKAKNLVHHLEVLIKSVEENTLHNKYTPNKLNRIRRRLNEIKNDPATSIIAGTRNLLGDIHELQEDIEFHQAIFNAIYGHVIKAAQEVLELMNNNRTDLFFTDENGNRIIDEQGNGIQVEIDFWTNGGYTVLEKEVIELNSELENNRDLAELDVERLNKILERLETIRAEQEELILLAVRRGMSSENRVIISEDIVDALIKQGYQLKRLDNGEPAHFYCSGEIEADQREAVFAILKNGVGAEITVIVHPDQDLLENRVFFQRNDRNNLTEQELRTSISEIKGIIENRGYKMGNAETPSGTGDFKQEELADANALAKVGISKGLKERLGVKRREHFSKSK